jgi:hypothetical protein
LTLDNRRRYGSVALADYGPSKDDILDLIFFASEDASRLRKAHSPIASFNPLIPKAFGLESITGGGNGERTTDPGGGASTPSYI